MKVAGGQAEDGIVIGNTYDKYGTRNPIARRMVAGFDGALSDLVAKVRPASIHEVGCGEGYWVMRWLGQAIDARGTDFSTQIIGMAKENASGRGMDPGRFEVRSIYESEPERDADLIVEGAEGALDEPEKALQALQRVARCDLILSVPQGTTLAGT